MSDAARTKRRRKKRSRAYRAPLVRFKGPPTTLDELLDPYRVFVAPSGCWLWLGADDGRDGEPSGGYGRVLKPGTRLVEPAHRYVFRTFKGPIPDGYDVDHECARWPLVNMIDDSGRRMRLYGDGRINRKCVNPDHLKAVPCEVNQALRRQGWLMRRMECQEVLPLPAPRPTKNPTPLLAPGECFEDLAFR